MIDPVIDSQVEQCLILLKKLFGKSLVGVYLYGSSILEGILKYSDVDLLVVFGSPLTNESKASLVNEFLKISGRYMKEIKRPLEVTVISHQATNPWQYSSQFEFQYGEWLRDNFEQGEFNPWSLMTMPDLAIILTQVLLMSKRL